MLQDKTIFVVGGDLRQAHLASLLSENNRVYTLGLEKAEGLSEQASSCGELQKNGVVPDYIVFPMPVGSDDVTVNTPFSAKRLSIDSVLSLAAHDTVILGGKLSAEIEEKLKVLGLPYVDYLKREELAILNAVPAV